MHNKVTTEQLFLFVILSYSLNLVWEVAHSYLYQWDKLPLQNNVYYYIPKILGATFGDLFVLILIFLIISLLNKNMGWINHPRYKDYFLIIFLGLLFAVVIEIKAKIVEKWYYSDLMPTIFGIGLTPLLQLTITFLIALWLIRANS